MRPSIQARGDAAPGTRDGGSAALLERSSELETLGSLVHDALAGRGGLLVIHGDGGIGKSSLLDETQKRAVAREFRILSARCSDLEAGFAFGAVRQLFDPMMISAENRRELLVGPAAHTAVLFDPGPGASAEDSFLVWQGLYWLIADLSASGPVAILVDDLQWCDTQTLRFLTFLAPRVSELRLAVVATARPSLDPAVRTELDRLTGAPDVRSIHPRPLSSVACATVVRQTIARDASDAFCTAFWHATGGSPLLVRTLAATCVEHGRRTDHAAIAELTTLAADAIGRRVRTELDRLGGAAAHLASAVAVLRDTDLAAATALAHLPPPVAQEAANRLVEAQLLRHADGRLSFVHPLLQAAVYSAIPALDLGARHAEAAAVEHANGGDPERVASHILLSPGRVDSPMLDVLAEAAARATARTAAATGLRYLERALQHAEAPDDRRRILRTLAPMAAQLGDGHALEYLREAMATTENPAEWADLAQLFIRTAIFAGSYTDATAIGEEALQKLHGGAEDQYQKVVATLGHASLYDPTHAGSLAELAAAARQRPPSPGVGGRMLDCFVATYETMSCGDRAVAAARATRALAGGGLAVETHCGEAWLAGCLALLGTDLVSMSEHGDHGARVSRAAGSTLGMCIAAAVQGIARLYRGDLVLAEGDLGASLDLARAAQLDSVYDAVGSMLARSLAGQGKVTEAQELLDQIWSATEVPGLGSWWWFLFARGRVHAAARRWPEALAAFQQCGARYRSHGWDNPAVIPWRSSAAVAARKVGDHDVAHRLVEEELRLAERWGDQRALGNVLRVAAALRADDPAAEHELLSRSAELLRDSPAQLDRAATLLALGRLGRYAQHPDAAAEHLTEALHLASIAGAKPLADACREALRSLGRRPRRPFISGVDSLTASERRVAALAAKGSSNREVAEELYVTVKTVDTHLGAVFRKLGITNRGQLAERLRTSSSV